MTAEVQSLIQENTDLRREIAELKADKINMTRKIEMQKNEIAWFSNLVENRCEMIDASFIRPPCYKKVCTRLSNDKYEEEEV